MFNVYKITAYKQIIYYSILSLLSHVYWH